MKASASTLRLHDARERLVCVQMAKVRANLRLSAEAFGKALGLKAARIETLEGQRTAWSDEDLQRAMPILSDLLTVAQSDVDDCASLLAEIAEESGELQ